MPYICGIIIKGLLCVLPAYGGENKKLLGVFLHLGALPIFAFVVGKPRQIVQ